MPFGPDKLRQEPNGVIRMAPCGSHGAATGVDGEVPCRGSSWVELFFGPWTVYETDHREPIISGDDGGFRGDRFVRYDADPNA